MCKALNNNKTPIVINTWAYPEATITAWKALMDGGNRIDALELGCAECENIQCGQAVGFGGTPDENGETTLDAQIYDGATMNMGAVAGLRRIKNSIKVARCVLENTEHSLLVGDQATNFAKQMGFPEESLFTSASIKMWEEWKNNNCQPNFWKKVQQNSSGPNKPISNNANHPCCITSHDTIGMVVIDNNGDIAAGTSTNGLIHKIAGRVGDSPIPGAGAYAANNVGAACATGDGDKMMRFLPSFYAIELLRIGTEPTTAAQMAVDRITQVYPSFWGAVIVLNAIGDYGAACSGMDTFPFVVYNNETNKALEVNVTRKS
ncbi:hypothetical protein FQA39_LY08480 [Lamprigera yunnana]|nr:hypothetical protein FQA39_LY08480 [Lamprigera yunnana]